LLNALAGLALLCCGACPDVPPAPREKPAASPGGAVPEPVDGQRAFYQMYVAARSWAPDAQGLRLESLEIPEVQSSGGRAGAWRATLMSPGKGMAATFSYSVAAAGGKLVKGVFRDHEEGYSEGLARPWLAAALRIGSEKALEVALAQPQTQAYLKENPGRKVKFVAELTRRHPDLAWRVIWGESVSRSDFSVFVDASTGRFLEVMR
jgi:hypothetical protein